MTSTPETFSARSWLFAPGDSEKKMGKAAAGPADIVVFDLEDAVTDDGKPRSRAMISAFLAAQPDEDRRRLWVRVNPLDGPHALADLAAVMPARPGGIMQGAPRLVAMTWGAEDLADAVGASENRSLDGSYGFTYELARSLCLLGAAAAGVTPVDTIQADFRDLAGLRDRAERVRRDGYRGMLAIHPAQVDVINEAFTPTAAELAAAREIVDLFAAHPGVGAVSYQGAMLDRPHLARAQALLASGRRG